MLLASMPYILKLNLMFTLIISLFFLLSILSEKSKCKRLQFLKKWKIYS